MTSSYIYQLEDKAIALGKEIAELLQCDACLNYPSGAQLDEYGTLAVNLRVLAKRAEKLANKLDKVRLGGAK